MRVMRWSVILCLVFLIAIAASISGCMVGGGKVVVLPLSGTIAGAGQQSLLTGAGISPGLVRSYLERAAADSSVEAVVLRIDSPGGSAAASQEIASDIRRFKETTGKPVVVSMGDVAASGGYYISIYADKIVASPGTITGSIGVISSFIYIEGLLEKLGLEMEIVKAGEHKDMGTRRLTEEERRIMQEITDSIYQQFVEAVTEGLGCSDSLEYACERERK